MPDLISPAEHIPKRILILHGQRVLLDVDLAELYGVRTKRLNEQVKRNARKFPADSMFQLSQTEKEEVVAKCDHLRNLRYSKTLPYAFTEHGAIQAANVLNSNAATEMGVHVVRAFVRLRHLMLDHATLTQKLIELDTRVGAHDEQLARLIEAIRELMASPEPVHRRKIGFHAGNR